MFAARDVFWHPADKIRSGLMVTNPGDVPFRTSPHVANHRIGRRCRGRINPVDQALRRTDARPHYHQIQGPTLPEGHDYRRCPIRHGLGYYRRVPRTNLRTPR